MTMTAVPSRRVPRPRLLMLLLASLVFAIPAGAQSCPPLKTGLVLSGGGAKGFAHIGVFKILDSLHIRPDFIVGSSIGAIAGALYASGYTGIEIDSITRALPIANVIRSYNPVAPGVMSELPAFAVWENSGRGLTLQTGAVREAEVNALMSALTLRGNLLARGDFDRLPIPLRVIATKLSNRSAVVLSKGDLAQALRASFAIPLIFSPGMIGDDMLVDGGVADNIPVAAARAMGAERLIISTLPTGVVSDELLGDPIKLAMQLADYLFRNDTTGFRPQDVVIRNRTSDFSPLDFAPAVLDSLVLSGMQVAREAFARAGCINTLRSAAASASVAVPSVPTLLSDFRVVSERRLESQTLQTALGLRAGRRFNEDSLQRRILRLGESDDYRALWLTPTGRDSSVTFTVTPTYGARQVVAVGLAYDNDLGARLWGGVAWRTLFGASVEASTAVDVAKYRQEFRAGLRRRIPAFKNAAPLIANFRAVSEDIRIFTDSIELNPIGTRELSVGAGVSRRTPLGFSLDIAPTVRVWSTGKAPEVGAVGLHLLLSDGARLADVRTIVEGEVNTRFQRAHIESNYAWKLGDIRIVPRARVSWSRRAPLQQQFFLGGYDGFGGLHTTERRGEQEAMAGLSMARIMFGPLRAVGEVTVGSIGSGPGFLKRQEDTHFGEVITGGRIGGEIRSQVFNVLIQRGFNSAGGAVWFARLGQWF